MDICPYCRFDNSPYRNNPVELAPPYPRSPVCTCVHCKKEYCSEDYEELYLAEENYDELLSRARYRVGFYPFIMIALTALAFFIPSRLITGLCSLLAVGSIFDEIKKYQEAREHKSLLSSEYLCSKGRCEVPQYLEKLAYYGYPFSKRFLSDNPEFSRWLKHFKMCKERGFDLVEYDPHRSNIEWAIIENQNI